MSLDQKSPQMLVELLFHLGRLAHGDAAAAGLTSAQWTGLRYLRGANRFSRTPSAFADFHGTTRGTASQTIRSLVRQGYIVRTPSSVDGRSTQLALTEKGEAILADDPFRVLVQAVKDLPAGVRHQFSGTLQRMLEQVAAATGKQLFGSCTSCHYLEGSGDGGSGAAGCAPYACKFINETLEADEIGQYCVNFLQSEGKAAKRATRTDQGGTTNRASTLILSLVRCHGIHAHTGDEP